MPKEDKGDEHIMKFSVLASGSTGNAFYIESDETRLLVDAGLSGKQTEGLLEQIGKSARAALFS